LRELFELILTRIEIFIKDPDYVETVIGSLGRGFCFFARNAVCDFRDVFPLPAN
jgi:hypothetical protein